MDLIHIPESKAIYRVLPSKKGLTLHPAAENEAAFKLCRIENKTNVKNRHVQLNLHDGTNLLFRTEDSQIPEGAKYETLNTLKIGIPDQEVLDYIKLVNGAYALITGGKNAGQHGKVVAIEEKPGQKRRDLLVTIENSKGDQCQTILDYIFVVGRAAPEISLPEVK